MSGRNQHARPLVGLHLSILLISFTGICSKSAANNAAMHGLFDMRTLLFLALMVLICGVYALLWQQNLKHFDVNVAYAHRSVYNIWSLLWAVLIFHERLTPGNLIGTLLIIAGVLVLQHE